MADHILPGTPPVPLVLRRSARARRISLRVSRLDGRVTLTLPKGVAEAEALAFAREKSDWIRGHLAERPAEWQAVIGAHLPIEGQMRQIVAAPGRRIVLHPDCVQVPPDAPGRRLQVWLKQMARERLVAASERHCAALGQGHAGITLRDTRSRWGSCSAQGALMYSWRLILAPPDVLDYVAAHEVAHLAEMNHSPAFWAVVRRLYGPYDAARGWLRDQGNTLHRYRFEA